MDLRRPYPPDPYTLLPEVASFQLTSDDVIAGQLMDSRFSQDGDNLSPHLAWAGAPRQTVSFAVSCFDPDAPTPSGFWHWTVLNLPTDITSLPRGFGDPEASWPYDMIRARNDGGTLGYIGAAPPVGDHPHRYVFAVHALDAKLDLPQGIPCTPAAFTMVFHTIARATLTPTYSR
ncbi:MAG: YbhB/YbcL family Raf kinase inhibitor-like protein [Propionibacteriaceae bacterium]|jgi:Raf kinase inhibitor-like YbhB/YbcL family protein|nr:YbhB/YbcL family Raf kinase inhibitor-like protein [Propionibacteriaceae bacterium]